MDYFDKTLITLKQLAKPYGYTIIQQFDEIIIRTKFEKWKFKPVENGKTRLLHADPRRERLSQPDAYHEQLRREISLDDLMIYVHEHELGKFSGRPLDFTLNKDGSKK